VKIRVQTIEGHHSKRSSIPDNGTSERQRGQSFAKKVFGHGKPVLTGLLPSALRTVKMGTSIANVSGKGIREYHLSDCRADGLNLFYYFSESFKISEMLAARGAIILNYFLMITFYSQTVPIHITKGTGHQNGSNIILDKYSF
jgi:hypothetical protein